MIGLFEIAFGVVWSIVYLVKLDLRLYLILCFYIWKHFLASFLDTILGPRNICISSQGKSFLLCICCKVQK